LGKGGEARENHHREGGFEEVKGDHPKKVQERLFVRKVREDLRRESKNKKATGSVRQTGVAKRKSFTKKDGTSGSREKWGRPKN